MSTSFQENLMTTMPLPSLRSVLSAATACSCLVVSTPAAACPSDPYVSAVCIMAMRITDFRGFMQANGATIQVVQYQALYSLIGTTYGGTGNTTFLLPDLRGRVVIGTGQGTNLPLYNPGDNGGANTVTLNNTNVPLVPHAHALTPGATATVAIGNLSVATTMTGLAATTSLANVTATASASGLNLKGFSGNGLLGTASGNALATPTVPSAKIYASSTPDVTMAAGSISGSAPVTFTGTPTTTITGTPTTTLSGLPTVTLGGSTAPMGAPAASPVSVMQPYLAMNYFIAVEGMYPSRN
jgi:microcystin-dependent protein